ncbi:MAG TPA: dihydroneopterin aldolase [Beijerinckiaceae bacterium]
MSDRILLKDLQVFAHHGVAAEEQRLGQRFSVDVTAHLDLRPAGEGDDLRKTVDYDALARLVIETLTARRFSLIEAAAEAVAQAVLARFPAVERVEVEVRKPAAPIDAVFGYVAVAVERRRGA